jgi:hypothetical protein
MVGRSQCFGEPCCLHLQPWSPEDHHTVKIVHLMDKIFCDDSKEFILKYLKELYMDILRRHSQRKMPMRHESMSTYERSFDFHPTIVHREYLFSSNMLYSSPPQSCTHS